MSATPLHRDERAVYLRQLQRRAERLARLTKASHADIPVVLALFVWQLLKAAIPLCGEQLREQFFEWVGRSIRNANHLCQFCGAEKPKADAPMCQDCWDEANELDQQQLLEDADEGRPQ